MELVENEERATAQEPMESLQDKLERIRRLVETGKPSTTYVETCPYCYGTGMEMIEGKGVRRCRCRRAVLISERLSKVPPRYVDASLENLYSRDDLHPSQKMIVELVKSHPEDSYVFCGRFNTGKTHFMWALYNHIAHDTERRVVACTMLQLINEYREAFRPRKEDEYQETKVQVRPNDLMQSHTPYSLFFDDIDKPKITEYVAEQIHALLDAAYIHKHQIVVTTNLSPDRLKEHFEKADERYGGAIVRRIVHSENNLIELF